MMLPNSAGEKNVYSCVETIYMYIFLCSFENSYRAAIKCQAPCDTEVKKTNVVSSNFVVLTAMK